MSTTLPCLSQAVDILESRTSSSAGYIADPEADPSDPGIAIERMRELLARLDNPHRTVATIHVAGSNGKTSTCYFIANICQTAGYRTGLYTSPHLHSYRERVAINGDSIPPREFAKLISEIDSVATELEKKLPQLGPISAFDLLTAAGLTWFSRARCEIAIIEVGLGGRYDPTNIIKPLVSVITAIELEHTSYLGTELETIARNKAGIVKPGVPVVSQRQNNRAEAVIVYTAADLGSTLMLEGRDWQWTHNGDHLNYCDSCGSVAHLPLPHSENLQCTNAATATCVARDLSRQHWNISSADIRTGLASTTIPGRFETRSLGGYTYIFDGAHTPRAARHLVAGIEQLGHSTAPVVFGVLGDKDVEGLLSELKKIALPLIIVPQSSVRSRSAESISAIAAQLAMPSVQSAAIDDALERAGVAAVSSGAPIVVTGSLKTVAQAREALGLADCP